MINLPEWELVVLNLFHGIDRCNSETGIALSSRCYIANHSMAAADSWGLPWAGRVPLRLTAFLSI